MKKLLSRVFALMLVAVIGLTGCSAVGPSDGLTGNYSEDTVALIDSLRESIALPNDAPGKAELQEEAKAKINGFASRYRRNGSEFSSIGHLIGCLILECLIALQTVVNKTFGT